MHGRRKYSYRADNPTNLCRKGRPPDHRMVNRSSSPAALLLAPHRRGAHRPRSWHIPHLAVHHAIASALQSASAPQRATKHPARWPHRPWDSHDDWTRDGGQVSTPPSRSLPRGGSTLHKTTKLNRSPNCRPRFNFVVPGGRFCLHRSLSRSGAGDALPSPCGRPAANACSARRGYPCEAGALQARLHSSAARRPAGGYRRECITCRFARSSRPAGISN